MLSTVARSGAGALSNRQAQQSASLYRHQPSNPRQQPGASTSSPVAAARRKFDVKAVAEDVEVDSRSSSYNTDLFAFRQRLSSRLIDLQDRESDIQQFAQGTSRVNKLLAAQSLHPSQGWQPSPHHLSREQLWEVIQTEARADAASEPALASFLFSTVLVHSSLEKSLSFLLANKLANATMLGTQLMRLMQEAYEASPQLIDAACADLQAVFDRDPACDNYSQCMLYFKGFQAVQCYRISHYLWQRGRKALALAIQSRISEAFQVDIHPAAKIGQGIMIDHATGVVIGETAVVGDNVSMLHHVTLGGSGVASGVRHPIIGHGVLIGAGVSVLGPVTVGAGSKVGAGSVVVTDLPTHCVAVGVPAKVIRRDMQAEPCTNMDQTGDFILDYVI